MLNFYKVFICLLFFQAFLPKGMAQLPRLEWIAGMGGNGVSKATGIAVDKYNNIYISGIFNGTIDFDPSHSTALNLTSKGGMDVFVAKYDPNGKLIWAGGIGGTDLDQPNNMSVDEEGNVFVTGQFKSPEFDADPGPGIFKLINAGGEDIFIFKLKTDGSFSWAKQISSSSTERTHAVTVDSQGNAIITGIYTSDLNIEGTNLTAGGGADGLVAKYNNDGVLLWAHGLRASGSDEITSVHTDKNDNILLTGYYSGSADFDFSAGVNVLTSSGTDNFAAKYGASGNLIWVNRIDGNDNSTSWITCDSDGDVYLTGSFSSTIDFDLSSPAGSLNASGIKDVFITKYRSDGTFEWANKMGGASADGFSYFIVPDEEKNVYITGYFNGTIDFDPAVSDAEVTSIGSRNIFTAKYDKDGRYKWAFGSGSHCVNNMGVELAVDGENKVLVTGAFCQTVDFDPGSSCMNIITSKGLYDSFLTKYHQDVSAPPPVITSFSLAQQASAAVIDAVNRTVEIEVVPGTDLTALSPDITVSYGIVNPGSNTVQDFSSPKTYTVYMSCISYDWLVTIRQAVPTVHYITACSGDKQRIAGDQDALLNPLYQWELFETGDWISAPGQSSGKNYSLELLQNYTNQNKIFSLRRKVANGSVEYFDSLYEISLSPSTSGNKIQTNNNISCPPAADILITGSNPIGASALIKNFKWQQSADSETWYEIPGEYSKDITVSSLTVTTYFRRVTETAGCIAYSDTLALQVVQTITAADAGPDIQQCANDTFSMQANAPGAGEVGSWEVIEPSGFNPFDHITIHDPLAVLRIPEDRQVTLQWSITNPLCGQLSSDIVELYNSSVPDVRGMDDKTVNFGEELILNPSVAGNGNLTYSWEPQVNISNPHILNPVVSPSETTTYRLTVSNENDCTASDTIRINVLTDLVIPNTFTPNGDGINDVWNIKNIGGYTNCVVNVYNRYGKQVFFSKGYFKPWNGTFENRLLPLGIYYYTIRLNSEKSMKELKGSLSILY